MQVFSVSHWIRKIGPRWPNLGPSELGLTWGKVAVSWAQLNPKLAPIGHVGLKLGPKRSRRAPNWSHVMHMEIQVTSKVAQVGTLWRQLHTKLGPTGTQHGEHCVKGSVINSKKRGKCRWKRAFWGFCIGPALSPLWSNMGLNLGRSCSKRSKLGPSYAIGRNWSQVGPSWARWSIWPMLGRYAKFANYHSRVHFFADGSIRATHFLDISTSTHGPNVMCFWHFDFDMCVVPQRRHFFDISSSKSGPMLKC